MESRRDFLRFDISLNLAFKPLGEETWFSFGKTKNFSRKGFCFESDNFDITSEKNLEFKLETPGKETFINGIGEIIWDKRIKDKNLVGVKLKKMHDESNWNILDYCYNKWLEKRHDKYNM